MDKSTYYLYRCGGCKFRDPFGSVDGKIYCTLWENYFKYGSGCEEWVSCDSYDELLHTSFNDDEYLGDTSPKEDTPQDEYYPDFKWVE